MAAKKKTTPTAATTSKEDRAARDTPVAASTKPATTKSRRAARDSSAKKTSALDAAARVLDEAGAAMSCPEMIETMAAKRYWKSPGGKTPAATLYSAILRELKQQGNKSRFKKTGPGRFARV